MPDASFPDLGSTYSYFLSFSFAATGWTNGASGAYATVSLGGQSFQCRPGNSCNNPSLELCQANIEISPAVLAAAGGTLVIQASIDNANLIRAPACSYQGSGIYAQYSIQGSHGMPTPAPTTPAPNSQSVFTPTALPTLVPTSPSAAPTPQPTMGVRMRVSQSSGAVVLASGLLGSIAPVTFSGLGSATTYYLSVGVYGTSFGGNSDANYASLSVTVGYGGRDTVVAAKCNPGDSCPDPQLTVCVGNFMLSPPFSPDGGGSVVLKAATVGFLTTRCTAGDSSVNVTYTLQGSDPMPTFEPSAAPTGLAPSSLLAQASASTNAIITGTGALFYVIAAVAALFAVLSVLLAQNKQTRPAVYQISLLSGIVAMTLVGGAFVSEMFLVDAMLGTPSGVYLGYAVLLGRVMHLPAACYLLHGMFSGGKASRLGSYLDLDLVFSSAKLFGVAALFSLIDVTAVRFFPWLSSPFSRKADGFPTALVFRVCVITKLVQSVVTVSCQISYFALVNSAVTADTPQARQSLAFLCINMATTILLVLLNAFEFVVKGSVLKGGEISDVPDEDSSFQSQSERRERGPSHLPSLPPPKQRSIFGRFSQRLSFSQVFAPAVSDSIPQPLSFKGSSSGVANPMMQSGSTKQSFSSAQSQDIEMVLVREQEMKAEMKALAQQNALMQQQQAQMQQQNEQLQQQQAQMQQQFGAMMAMITKLSEKLAPDEAVSP